MNLYKSCFSEFILSICKHKKIFIGMIGFSACISLDLFNSLIEYQLPINKFDKAYKFIIAIFWTDKSIVKASDMLSRGILCTIFPIFLEGLFCYDKSEQISNFIVLRDRTYWWMKENLICLLHGIFFWLIEIVTIFFIFEILQGSFSLSIYRTASVNMFEISIIEEVCVCIMPLLFIIMLIFFVRLCYFLQSVICGVIIAIVYNILGLYYDSPIFLGSFLVFARSSLYSDNGYSVVMGCLTMLLISFGILKIGLVLVNRSDIFR